MRHNLASAFLGTINRFPTIRVIGDWFVPRVFFESYGLHELKGVVMWLEIAVLIIFLWLLSLTLVVMSLESRFKNLSREHRIKTNPGAAEFYATHGNK